MKGDKKSIYLGDGEQLLKHCIFLRIAACNITNSYTDIFFNSNHTFCKRRYKS